MSFLHDAIMESNELEDMLFQNIDSDDIITEVEKIAEKEKIEESCHKEQSKEEIIEEELVDIEDYLPQEAYVVESMQLKEAPTELPDRYAKGRPGSPEYNANDRRRAREAAYRKLANIDSDFKITEDNIIDWAFKRVCSDFRCDPEKFKAELLKQPYTGLERYDED